MKIAAITIAVSLIILSHCIPAGDIVNAPGMIDAVIYSGYLSTDVLNRRLHYVFIEANVTDPDTAPLTLWLNGGPGCSSLIGMIQQIGPFIVGNSYQLGDQLKKNDFSWDKASNLLFFQSPAIVGFSSDTNTSYEYNDEQTADDAFAALKNFIFSYAPEFANRQLFISGQSYAGKYIPDITTRILANNRLNSTKYINLKGIIIGNGVMDFTDSSLTKSSIDYMVEHDFISERLINVYKEACSKDFYGPRCRFFRYEFDLLRSYINHYNVYEVCISKTGKPRSSEANRLLQALSSIHSEDDDDQLFIRQKRGMMLGEIPECPSDDGAIQYWNLNKVPFHVNSSKVWAPCSRLTYKMTESGSMKQYLEIFKNKGIKTWLFSGDWDDVVPYTDTEKNIIKLERYKAGEWSPWLVGESHAGFYQAYDNNVTIITVKGASHMVPQTKPKASYQMFYNFIKSRPINTPV